MAIKKHLFLFVLFFCGQFALSQYISVDENYTAQQLVENILFSNSCSGTVSNVSVSGGNFGTSEQSWGYFNANGSSFPFQDGIILSTGKIQNAIGPNSSLSDDNANGWGGDNDLNQALNISNSINATTLEFDFIPSANKISFDYIFSSEEYHGTATCTYSDGFAFLLKEVGTSSYQNLALIPNTNIPVKVTTVHPEIPNGCAAQNEEYFDAFNGTNHPTNYNGQTVVLTAKANVIPGNTYHIKLVIADEANYRYDSAIFLLGGSFAYEVDLGENRTFANENPICYNENFMLDASVVSGATYQWYFNGISIAGATNSTLSFNPPYSPAQNGEYAVVIDQGTTCEKTGNIFLDFSENIQSNQTTFSFCDTDSEQDGYTTFSAADITTIITNAFPTINSNYTLQLFENPNGGEPITLPYTNTTAHTQLLYAQVTNANCFAPNAFPITLEINAFVVENKIINTCNNSPVVLEAVTANSYLWNTGETSQNITVDVAGSYSVTVTNNNNCSTVQQFTVINSEIATIDAIIVNDFSANNTAEVLVSGSGAYNFSLDGINYQESAIFTNLEEGEYTVFVKDKKGCGTVSKNFYVLDYPKYFTPNGDGINDFWTIKNLKKRGFLAVKIYIFDRYGKLIKEIKSNEAGWNGTFNGYNLPATDYWFVLELNNERTVKGHFSLIR
ncbi:choice-of-anchor L domain-containing protein [Flavobacterium sp.]|uniref:T9SS type B sorting domain-containing protein n=1 Tax=Flavobacterium sp. TaxID=239 RepID=UPI0035279339